MKISVKDNGVGMTKNEQKKLFKLFATMKNTRESNT
jgi:signal transduction histidine kinase